MRVLLLRAKHLFVAAMTAIVLAGGKAERWTWRLCPTSPGLPRPAILSAGETQMFVLGERTTVRDPLSRPPILAFPFADLKKLEIVPACNNVP